MNEWRYLTADEVDAADGLAVDEALMLRHGRGRIGPTTLRLYTYRDSALVGRYQSLADEVDAAACARLGVQMGRRPTGGGAIVMTPAQLGVAVTARALAEEAPRETLARYARGVVAGLEALGIEAHFRRKNDLEVGGRKIAGLGLYLDPTGAVLFHASLLVELDVARMLEVLHIPGAKLSDKAVSRVEDRVTTVARELGRTLGAADVRNTFAAGFARTFGAKLVPASLFPDEAERARALAQDKYRSPGWLDEDSPRRDARGTAVLKTPDGLVRVYVGVHGETIKSVMFTGDYNILPEAMKRLEAALRWCGAELSVVAAETERAVGAGALGVSAAALTGVIWEATRRARDLEGAALPLREGACYFPEGA